jgi:hypothetical protein
VVNLVTADSVLAVHHEPHAATLRGDSRVLKGTYLGGELLARVVGVAAVQLAFRDR